MTLPSPPRMPLNRLVICADDYGISPAVSRGIRELAAAGRISATGAMTCMPSWPAEAPLLQPLADRVGVGLHFTLTDQRALGAMPELAPQGVFPTIGSLLKRSLAGRVPTAEVAAELDRQLDSFERHFGRPPDFIDGHQHVHLLPGVRKAVLALFGRRLDPRRCWLRDCSDSLSSILRRGSAPKAGFIAALGFGLARSARARGIVTNRSFSGFYDYSRQDFGQALPGMLADAADGHLLMVHPGHVDGVLEACDSLTAPREDEWRFLMGPTLPELLADKALAIAGREFPGYIHAHES